MIKSERTIPIGFSREKSFEKIKEIFSGNEMFLEYVGPLILNNRGFEVGAICSAFGPDNNEIYGEIVEYDSFSHKLSFSFARLAYRDSNYNIYYYRKKVVFEFKVFGAEGTDSALVCFAVATKPSFFRSVNHTTILDSISSFIIRLFHK